MHANIVVGLLLVALVAQAALSMRLVRLRARMARLEGKELELFRSILAVRRWVATEIGALQGAVTVREPSLPLPVKREAKPEAEAEQDPEEQRATIETPVPIEVLQGLQDGEEKAGEDNDATTVFDPEALRHALRPPPLLCAEEEEEEKEPLGQERSGMVVTAFHSPEKEGTPWPR